NWTNSFGKEDDRADVPALNRILDKFAPKDVIERVGWLLATPWPSLPQGQPGGYEAREAVVKAAQKAAAREVLDSATIEQILAFSSTISYQGVLGQALAAAVRDETESNMVLDAILARATDMPVLVRGYAIGHVREKGPGWIDAEIARLKSKGNYSP